MCWNMLSNTRKEKGGIAVDDARGVEEEQKTAHDADGGDRVVQPPLFQNHRRGDDVAEHAAQLKGQDFVRHHDVGDLVEDALCAPVGVRPNAPKL